MATVPRSGAQQQGDWRARIQTLAGECDVRMNRGVEREALRVTPEGNLAQTSHPAAFGSKLTHPNITTDFAEAQLELITAPHTTAAGALDELREVHEFVYANLGDELLWAPSMPCILANDEDIPFADFGESNIGRLKSCYRSGLGLRYGRIMQTICAVHYNFSLSDDTMAALARTEGAAGADFATHRYFDLMRNFRRFGWLLLYLFGASPAVCNSFVRGRPHDLIPFDEGTSYLPHATSLRSGNLGYQSDLQASAIDIRYNNLADYVGALAQAIVTPHDAYERLGAGEQLNTSILQSEAEFYSSIRAKRTPPPGRNFLAHLLENGVQYVEIRLLDVNPYLPLGIDAEQIDFLDTFLLHCLLTDSPEHDEARSREVSDNMTAATLRGRDPALELSDNGKATSLRDWAEVVMDQVAEVADALDAATGESRYAASVAAQRAKLGEPSLTPSGRMLQDMESAAIPFFRFGMNQSLNHRAEFLAKPVSKVLTDKFQRLSAESVAAARALTARKQIPFEQYLAAQQNEYRALP